MGVNVKQLVNTIHSKKSFLCVGLDTDIQKLPAHFPKSIESIVDFNKAIIDATADLTAAYKINTAFYEQYGAAGWEVMAETLSYIPKDCFTIADAKRGDIGNTSSMYAKAFFENLRFDSITVSPYMGEDSVRPFLESGKVVIVLALTSNKGSNDFQHLLCDGKPLYAHVLESVNRWADADQLMYVVGATRAEYLANIRKMVPENFLLVPGVGSQGGSLEDVVAYGMNSAVGLLVNSSRGIIYASSGEDFGAVARLESLKLQKPMETAINSLR
jgi:orotidine-5'-phosphate decarboxylase